MRDQQLDRQVGRLTYWQPIISSIPRIMTLLSRYALALLFVLAGIWHFVHPATYLAIMPPWLPQPLALIYVSGVFEILGGLGLLPARTRRMAGWGLLALLVAVFPAN